MREPCLVVVVQDKLRAKMGNTVQPPAANAGDVIALRQLNMLHHAAHGGLHVSSSFWVPIGRKGLFKSVNVGLSAGDASQAPLKPQGRFAVRLGRVFHNKCLLSPTARSKVNLNGL